MTEQQQRCKYGRHIKSTQITWLYCTSSLPSPLFSSPPSLLLYSREGCWQCFQKIVLRCPHNEVLANTSKIAISWGSLFTCCNFQFLYQDQVGNKPYTRHENMHAPVSAPGFSATLSVMFHCFASLKNTPLLASNKHAHNKTKQTHRKQVENSFTNENKHL